MVEVALGALSVARLDNQTEQPTRRAIGWCSAPTGRHDAPPGQFSPEFPLTAGSRTYGRAT